MKRNRATQTVIGVVVAALLTAPAFGDPPSTERPEASAQGTRAAPSGEPERTERETQHGVTVVRHHIPVAPAEAADEPTEPAHAAPSAAVEVPLDDPLTQAVLEAMHRLREPDPQTYDPSPIPRYRDQPVRQYRKPRLPSYTAPVGQQPPWAYTPIPHEYQPQRDYRYRESAYRYIWRQRLMWRTAALVARYGSPQRVAEWAPLVPHQQDVY